MVCSAHLALFPNCEITPKSGDAVELLSLLEQGAIDAALLTLPADGIGLNVDKLSHDRLVVCMRSNDPAASLDEVAPSALEKKLKIFREPKQNPEGHCKLMEMLDVVGVHPEVARTTSTPRDIQWMVKSGYGQALILEGSELEDGVVTRPVAGVSWAVDCALISKKLPSQKTIPILVRALRKMVRIEPLLPPSKPPQSVPLSAAKRTLPLFG